jgi:hypothetical protein
MLADHARLGCEVLIARRGGKASPFVLTRHGKTLKNTERAGMGHEFTDGAAIDQKELGYVRQLWRGGPAAIAIDAKAPIEGLYGLFRPGQGQYYCGPHAPRLGDLAYTEFAVLRL